MLWQQPLHTRLWPLTNQLLTRQYIKTALLLCQQDKVCAYIKCVHTFPFHFFYLSLPITIYYWREKPSPHSQHFKKAWIFVIALLDCIWKKVTKKATSKNKKRRWRSWSVPVGLGGRTQKKRWGLKLKYVAGERDLAAWHPEGMLSVKIGTLALKAKWSPVQL